MTWLPHHDEILRALRPDVSLSMRTIAAAINDQCGTSYTGAAVASRALALGLPKRGRGLGGASYAPLRRAAVVSQSHHGEVNMGRTVPRNFWRNSDNVDKLKTLAAMHMPAAHIATMMQIPVSSVVSKALSLGIAFERFTEEEHAERRVKLREADRARAARRAVKRKASILPPVPEGFTKGSPAWRNQLPRPPEMSVQQRRDFIAEAFRNTARGV